MVLHVNNLSKAFGSNCILENVSFDVHPGEVVCITGRSGEGKTTLLRCINHLEIANKGTIRVGDLFLCKETAEGTVYASKEDIQKLGMEIGLVFQSFNLFPHMTVKSNLMIAPDYLGVDRVESEERARKLIDALGLEGKEESYPHELSGGQKQRVAIARASMLNPKILCFDEPTSALDEDTRDQIAGILRNLAASGMAVVIVSHDRVFVDQVADRILNVADKNVTEEKIA